MLALNPPPPDDVAEFIVFAATRRENVLMAELLAGFPTDQILHSILPLSYFMTIYESLRSTYYILTF
jgi:hypothetical protein